MLLDPGAEFDYNGAAPALSRHPPGLLGGRQCRSTTTRTQPARARLAQAGDDRGARAVLDGAGEVRRHRAARRRPRSSATISAAPPARPLHHRHAAGDRRRSAKRATTTRSSPASPSGSASPTAFTEGRSDAPSGCVHLYAESRERAQEAASTLPAFDAFWEAGVDRPAAAPMRTKRDARRLPRRSREAHALKTPARARSRSSPRRSPGSATTTARAIRSGASRWNGSAARARGRYPLHMLSDQPADAAAQPDTTTAWSAGRRRSTAASRSPCNPADAAPRGIATATSSRVFNDRGALPGRRGAERRTIRAGVVQIATGAWYDPAEPGIAARSTSTAIRTS